MVYMANCGGDCSSASPSSLDWFKIDESGLLSGTLSTGEWGMGELVTNNSSWTSTIPSELPSGMLFSSRSPKTRKGGSDMVVL